MASPLSDNSASNTSSAWRFLRRNATALVVFAIGSLLVLYCLNESLSSRIEPVAWGQYVGEDDVPDAFVWIEHGIISSWLSGLKGKCYSIPVFVDGRYISVKRDRVINAPDEAFWRVSLLDIGVFDAFDAVETDGIVAVEILELDDNLQILTVTWDDPNATLGWLMCPHKGLPSSLAGAGVLGYKDIRPVSRPTEQSLAERRTKTRRTCAM
jgi:hypothetical protein